MPREAGPTERRLALKTLLDFMREGHDDHPFISYFNDPAQGYKAIAERPEIPDSLTPESSDEDFEKAGILIHREIRPYFGPPES